MTDESPKAGRTLFINSLWAIFGRVAMRLLGAVSIIILARILTPEDYGIIALAMIVITILETMTTMGLDAALIANRNATEDHYNTVWTLHVLQGIVIGIGLAALAIPAANYFDEPELEIQQGRIEDGDLFVVCSDGLTEHVEDQEIFQASANSLSTFVETLINTTLERGAKDNVTVIAVACREVTAVMQDIGSVYRSER